MYYLYLKVFHIIGVIVWFAGLFYLGRLFVYHREADDRPEPERTTLKSQFSLMERRLFYGIAWPGLCISVVFGIALIIKIRIPGLAACQTCLCCSACGLSFMVWSLAKTAAERKLQLERNKV
ncbi:MAG: hypothetical protein CM1200mP30_02830 [Pseudomonadota bacterium]|nr:MAG: hypothetical protein CM1200mP30_02830 [Pseudomonadota bacterium]